MDFDVFMNDVVRVARGDMTEAGYKELKTKKDVDSTLQEKGTTLVMVNSVCSCASGIARSAATNAIHYDKDPHQLLTVFAGQEKEATEQARTYFGDYPPFSPSFAFLKDGEIVSMIERHDIEGFSPVDVINKLQTLFDEHCEEI